MEFINFVSDKVIDLKMDCKTKEDFFKEIHNKVFDLGFVKEEFGEKILERENVFPTGLNLGDYGVAIPHTDAEYIKEQFISVCTFNEPVVFSSMEDQDEKVPVNLAFVLGLNQPHSQLSVLTELMGIMQNKELVDKLMSSTDKEEVLKTLKSL